MAHDADDALPRHGQRLPQRHAPPAHAGVDLQVDRQPFRRLWRRERYLEPRVARHRLLAPGKRGSSRGCARTGRLSAQLISSRTVATQNAVAPPASAAREALTAP